MLLRFLPLLVMLLFFSPGLAEERWNLLFVYLDDFGWRDAGFMGSDFYETPNLDALADGAVVFTDAYSASANCAPARASLLSGQYTGRHKVYNVGTGPRGKSEHRKLRHIPGVDTLDSSQKTWASLIQGAGYRTALMGKWHLSDDPTAYGFDLNVAGTHSGSPPKGYYPPHPNVPGLGEYEDDEYLTDTLTDRAVSFIRENEKEPWLLYLSHFAVHTPLDAREDLVAKYEGKERGELHESVTMATMVEAVDEGVGRIMKALEETGQSNRTILVFSSDNGGYGPATSMHPLKGYKGTYYEGGIRVPLMIHWPGVVMKGRKSSVPVIGVDLFPTFLEMLGIAIPKGIVLDGESLVGLLRNGDDGNLEGRALFWHFPAYLQSYGKKHIGEQRDPLFRSRPCSVVRKGPWKLIRYYEDGDEELFNLQNDLSEMENLVVDESEMATELRTTLDQWLQETGSDLPVEKNPQYDPELDRKDREKLLLKR